MAGLPKPAFPDFDSGSMMESPKTSPTLNNYLEQLRRIVPDGEVHAAGADDQVDGVQPALIVEPANEAELAKALSFANDAGLAVAPRGHATKMSWGIVPDRADMVIAVTRLNRVLEHANHDMTVAVEAGVTIAELQRTLAQKGQRLALDPLWPDQATVGGVIATNDTGSLRLRFGGVRDLIIGITIVLPNGTIAVSGGKVVKNVAGYDLQKLMTGAFGTLGIISKAVFRLHPLPERTRTQTFSCPNTQDANTFILSIADSNLVPTGVQMRTSSQDPGALVDVRLEGVAAGVEAQSRLASETARNGAVDLKEDVISASGTSMAAESGIKSYDDVWQARERLWQHRECSTLFKLSVLPTELSSTAEFVRQQSPPGTSWSMVAQSMGLASLRVDLENAAEERVTEFVADLRRHLAKRSGTAVVLHCPEALKRPLDIWGDPGSARTLMNRIKQQFDPAGILNPGRFAGGI